TSFSRDWSSDVRSSDLRKVGDRAVALAEEAGHVMDRFDGIVVVANQGDLRHEGRPVRPYRGGASSLSDGRLMCNLAVDETLYLRSEERRVGNGRVTRER